MPDENSLPNLTLRDIDTAPTGEVSLGEAVPVSESNLRDTLAGISNEKDALQQELDRTRKRVRTIEILDELIEPYAKRSFIFMCAYCGSVGVILLMDGCQKSGFKLPDEVLKYLVGSTATTVIGLVGMVLTGIFVGARRKDD